MNNKTAFIFGAVFVVVLMVVVLGWFFVSPSFGFFSVGVTTKQNNPIISASSYKQGDNRSIGYEYLNASGDVVPPSQADTVHMWNTQDDYFFNKSSGIQFTNHFRDYWTRNVFCLGYYSGGNWNKINCADELSDFNRIIDTDNISYVNATLWKDITYSGYDIRLAVNYYLGLNDENLSITIYGKNIGEDIPYDVGFAWIVRDIEIPVRTSNDSVYINATTYNLFENNTLDFRNMTIIDDYDGFIGDSSNLSHIEYIPYYIIEDKTKYLRLDWDENLDYLVRLRSKENQEESSITWFVNAGSFNSGQSKSTTLKWIDADEYEWGITTIGSGYDSAINYVAGIGGTFGAEDGVLQSVDFYHTVTGDGNKIRIAVYTGGSLDNISGATLLEDLGQTGGAAFDWVALNSSTNPTITANSTVWIVWKGENGDLQNKISTNSGDAGDFQSARGRFIAGGVVNKSPSASFPSTYPTDSFTFADRWSSIHLNYTTSAEDTTPPTITVQIPQNQSYSDTTLDYNISVSETLHTAYYSLNGTTNYTLEQHNSTFYVNLTAEHDDLSTGLNNITFWVNDSSGNANQTTIYFTITTDTCTYSSGDWQVDCSDDCHVTTSTSLPSNNLTLYGTGNFTLSGANITANYINIDPNCNINLLDGGYFNVV